MDRLDATDFEPVTQAVRVISFICDKVFRRRDGTQQRHGHADVGNVAGVSAKATGRPRLSARQWIFECDRRASARPRAPTPAFCACCRAVRLHMRTVEAEFARNIARSCNLLEQALPKPALRPSVVAIVDRGGRTIFGRHVAPTASGLENVQNSTDDATIVDASLSGLPRGRCRSIAAHASSDSLNRCAITASRLDEPNQKVESPNKAIDCMGSLPKAGMIAFTQQVAIQNAEFGVRANVILPGLIDTPMAVDTRARVTGNSRAEVAAARDARVPLRHKMGTPWDVANAALFLASDEANFITGVALPVDGGALVHIN